MKYLSVAVCLLKGLGYVTFNVFLEATEQKDLFAEAPFAVPLRALAFTNPSGPSPLPEPAVFSRVCHWELPSLAAVELGTSGRQLSHRHLPHSGQDRKLRPWQSLYWAQTLR